LYDPAKRLSLGAAFLRGIKSVDQLYQASALRNIVDAVVFSAVHKILQPIPSKMSCADTQDEADGIHQVRFARAIWADNARELFEGSHSNLPFIRFEIVQHNFFHVSLHLSY